MGDNSSDGFSFIKSGPFRDFLIGRGWIKSAPAALPVCAVIGALICWLPLLLLSAIHGVALGNSVQIPFLLDFASHIRFLFAVPLLIIAEVPIERRLSLTAAQFVRSGLVESRDLAAFRSGFEMSARLGNSILAKAVLLILGLLGLLGGIQMELAYSSTWQISQTGAIMGRTAAGWWYAAVSLPIYRFLLYLWLWRLAVWSWFLRRASRMNLKLDPTHPDLAGGLGFLALGQAPFGIIIFAAASVISAILAERIIFEGASLLSFKVSIIGFVILSVLLFLAPLFLFIGKLYRLKKRGLLEYGSLASRYTRDFAQKWIRGEMAESPLGSPDLESLSGLADGFQIVRKMRLIPFELQSLVPLLAGAIVPMLPLAFIAFPLEDIVAKIIKLVF